MWRWLRLRLSSSIGTGVEELDVDTGTVVWIGDKDEGDDGVLYVVEEDDGWVGGGTLGVVEEVVDNGWGVGGTSGVVAEVGNGSGDNDCVGAWYWTGWPFKSCAGAIFPHKKPNNLSPWRAWRKLAASASELKWR